MGRGKSDSGESTGDTKAAQRTGVEVHKGKLRIRFMYKGKRCREPTGLKPTATNTKAAERIAADVRQQIRFGTFDYAAMFPDSKNLPKVEPVPEEPVQTLRDYAKIWKKTLTGEKSTKDGYTTQVENFWLNVVISTETDAATGEEKEIQLGDIALTEVRYSHIATAIASKANAGISGKTTNNILIPLRKLFDAADADGLIDVSPVAKVRNRKHQKAEIDPFTRAEMDAILAHMAKHYPHVMHDYFQFAFTTGIRPSELIALRWGDIDWNNKTATVKRAYVRHKLKDTKSHQIRHVDLNDQAIAALVRQKAATFMKGPNAFIFCTPEGEPWGSERRQREDFFYPALKATGIRQRHAYNARHTFATINLMAGVNVAYIASQMGHADVATLLKHYAKWIRGADSGAEAAKSRAVFGAGKKLELAPDWPLGRVHKI